MLDCCWSTSCWWFMLEVRVGGTVWRFKLEVPDGGSNLKHPVWKMMSSSSSTPRKLCPSTSRTLKNPSRKRIPSLSSVQGFLQVPTFYQQQGIHHTHQQQKDYHLQHFTRSIQRYFQSGTQESHWSDLMIGSLSTECHHWLLELQGGYNIQHKQNNN